MSGFALSEGLRQQRTTGLYRSRTTVASAQRPEVTVDGRRYLVFSSNNYLGLADHPKVIARFQQAANEYGVGSGASHLIIGHSKAHQALEEALAALTGRDRALLFGNGYMANLGAMAALTGREDSIFQDRLNHASLLDAAQLSGARWRRFRHKNHDHLVNLLAKSTARNTLIVTDGVFSMDGDRADLHGLSSIAEQHNAWLMVDDAHGIGVLGKNGGGSAEHLGLTQQHLPILMGTLGKAFGTYGAFIAGSDALIESLIQFARTYIYTTALPPAIAEATRASLQIIQQEPWRREHLKELIRFFRHSCEQLGIALMPSETPIQPLLTGSVAETLAVSEALAEQGILVSAIRPPTVPKGESRLRIALSAAHTKTQVEQLVNALDTVINHPSHQQKR
ncbi:8-amino-7-oxononanoate synthase [Candidatus Sororendozoicomonas aggregata]|uniref:8-amino-7-oxononanoate synthase n=1 Tax=Candidatus Sororendozoicomonas aggregata TaxID=3073239 RepID=UPI002ED20A29